MLTIENTFDIISKWYAINHPEGAFPWDNTLTFTFYGVYVVTMIVLFIAPFKKK